MSKNTHAGADGESAYFAPGELVRVTALRLALEHSGTATSALVDMSAALTDAGVTGLAWDSDYLTDRVAALAGEVALLVATETELAARAHQGQGDGEHDALAATWRDASGGQGR